MVLKKITEIKISLEKAIEKYSSIGILTHKNPDGDGLCAALALQEIIKLKGKKADVILEKTVPKIYSFLDGEKRTKVFSNHHIYKLLIILDCHEKTRIGECAPLLYTAKKIIAIDHHLESELIEDATTYIDVEAVSAGAIIFDLYEQEIKNFPLESANYIVKAIYITIVNDTDNFINSNTDVKTFLTCSKLMEYDLKLGFITEHFLLNKTADQMRFVGEVLSTIRTYENDEILFMMITKKMMERNHLASDATSKINRWVKGVRNIKASVSFQEIAPNLYRLSLRTNTLNVNKIAVKFGGGGHEKASGCEIKGALEEIQKQILDEFRKQL